MSNHDKQWEDHFITPIARTLKKRGVRYIRDDGKASYVLQPEIPENESDQTTEK